MDGGLTYTQAAGGEVHTVLLRSDGTAVACGYNVDGWCDLPALDGGRTYTQLAAGYNQTVLLSSDGTAVACGDNSNGQHDLPVWDSGLAYTSCPGPGGGPGP